MKEIFLSFFFVFSAVWVYADCWDIREIADQEFAELDGVMILSFKDAVNCEPLKNAKVSIEDKVYQTDFEGYVKIAEDQHGFDSLDKRVPIQARAENYITLETNLRVAAGTLLDRRFLLSRKLALESVRFVLQWSAKPRDLDLHLVGENFHVSFHDLKSVQNKARLDRDDVNSYGPETITLDKIENNQTYQVYVHNYSNESTFQGNERMQVYVNNQLQYDLTLKSSSERIQRILTIQDREVILEN